MESPKKYRLGIAKNIFICTSSAIFLSNNKIDNEYHLTGNNFSIDYTRKAINDDFLNDKTCNNDLDHVLFYCSIMNFFEMDFIKYITLFKMNRNNAFNTIKKDCNFNLSIGFVNVLNPLNHFDIVTADILKELSNHSTWNIALSKIISYKLLYLYDFNAKVQPHIKSFCQQHINDMIAQNVEKTKAISNNVDKEIINNPIPLVISTNDYNIVNKAMVIVKKISTIYVKKENVQELQNLLSKLNLDISVQIEN